MAEGSVGAEVREAIERFRLQLSNMGINCTRVLLFGSHARGEGDDNSDIDLIIVSPDWGGMTPRQRRELLGTAAARIMEPIQASGFTEEEIDDNRVPHFWRYIMDNQAIAA